MRPTKVIPFVASLPERFVRGALLTAGGAARLVTDTLLPSSLRATRFYRFFLGNTLKFITEDVGGVRAPRSKNRLPKDYLPRKMVGNVADFAGMFAFHFSPLWFFALLGDFAEGSKTYLGRIVAELKRDGTLPPGELVRSADDLLAALQKAAAKSTMPLDTPPLSINDLRKLRSEVTAGYRQLFAKSKHALPDVEMLWTQIDQARRREGVSLVRFSGAMAMTGARAVGRATGQLLHEKIIQSYGDSVARIRRRGFRRFMSGTIGLYVDALRRAASPSTPTTTERLIETRILGRRKT